MTYPLRVISGRGSTVIWKNFCNYIDENKLSQEDGLKLWHATNVWNSPFIEFEHEEDVTAFVLRWL